MKDIGNKIRLQKLIWISANIAKSSSIPPSTRNEQLLAELWAKILGIDPSTISREDDFFSLGGDSLGVMRLVTEAHEHDISLNASEVFKNPILVHLAQKVTEVSNKMILYRPYSLVTELSDLEAFVKTFIQPFLDISFDQIQDIFPANGFQVDITKNEEESFGLGLQYAYFDISSQVSWPRLADACQAVVRFFQCFRARFIIHEEKCYQVILRDPPILIEEFVSADQMMVFFNKFCAQDCRQAAINDIFTKLSLVNTGDCVRRVILRLSHMQNDGWCISLILKTIANFYNGGTIEKTSDWTSFLCYRRQKVDECRKYWRSILQDITQITPSLVFKPGGSKVRILRTFAIPNFHSSSKNRRTRPTVVVNVAWALVLHQLAGHNEVVFGNVTTGRNGAMPGLDSVIGPCVNMLPMRLRIGADTSPGTRNHLLRDLIEASAQQVDESTGFEGLDWNDLVDQCTAWPSGTRYFSSVHYRNMTFEPELVLGIERVIVGWYELVVTPFWTTVLVHPENDLLRLWLYANPVEIGDDGADDILHLLINYINEIVSALSDEV